MARYGRRMRARYSRFTSGGRSKGIFARKHWWKWVLGIIAVLIIRKKMKDRREQLEQQASGNY